MKKADLVGVDRIGQVHGVTSADGNVLGSDGLAAVECWLCKCDMGKKNCNIIREKCW